LGGFISSLGREVLRECVVEGRKVKADFLVGGHEEEEVSKGLSGPIL
jgi:hypothetical protein